jgi:glyoxalase family protein
MKLEGIHHITAVTADARRNVDFYARVLGLRMVKKTVNQDDPTVYHLFYADEKGSPGADLTFFEYPGAPLGRAGDGMVHRIVWRVGSAEALDFWSSRLADEGVEPRREGESVVFADPEGLEHELHMVDVADEPLIADHPEVPREHALQGFDGVRAYASDPEASSDLLEAALGFERRGEIWELRGEDRGGWLAYDPPPAQRGLPSAGTVHHVAWASRDEDQEKWRTRATRHGARATPVIDRFWFRSVYFREPSGVLFEIATLGPGFSTDEDPDHLGEKLVLPPRFESQRERIEATLQPVENPRAVAREA